MAETRYQSLQVRVERGVLVIAITEPHLRSIQFDTVDALREDMLAAHEASGATRVVVDLSNVTQFGSASFRPLLSLRRRLTESNGHLILCGMQPDVREVFLVTRLIDEQGSSAAPFAVAADVSAAIASLA
jgi:anti-sigma B factor antagonist